MPDIRETNDRVIREFRAGGEIEGMHRDRLLLLTTTGARTGEARTTPMLVQPDGGRLLVVASNNGATRAPHWFHNLEADPAVHVETDGRSFDTTAVVLSGEERATAWALLKRNYPFFADHEKSARRKIPVVALPLN